MIENQVPLPGRRSENQNGRPALLASRAHVLLADLDPLATTVVLSTAALRHLLKVLRLRRGELVTVTDGKGWWAPTHIPADDTDTFALTSPPMFSERRSPNLCIAFALTKGDKPDFTVQKLTECGIDRIVLLRSTRSVVRWDDDHAVKHLAKLKLVAAEAMMQSRGVWLPSIEGPVPCQTFAAGATRPVHRADMVGQPVGEHVTTIVIGPEGGWDEGERQLFPESVALTGTVLRAETAAIVAAGIMSSSRDTKSTHSAW